MPIPMKERTLRRLINRLVATSLVSPALLAGCDDGLPNSAPYSTPLCTAAGQLSVDGLSPATWVDYVDLRMRSFDGTPRILSKSGAQCATATDKAACDSKLAALVPTSGFHPCVDIDCAYSVAVTIGNDVRAYSDQAALTAFLSPIDAPQEAALLAFAAGYDVSCTDKSAGGVMSSSVGDGYDVLVQKMTKDCAPIEITGYQLHISRDGTISVVTSRVVSTSNACVGRRPAGLCEDSGAAALTPVGEYFGEIARLEAAAIPAFEQLAAELVAHGAPGHLILAAKRAAADEVRHARMTGALARRFGGSVRTARVALPPLRSLEEVARENAAEGCVRETFGAVIGVWQARTAQDPAVARAMEVISRDELRHAALSWQVAAWADAQLDAEARRRVRSARDEAVAELAASLYAEPLPDVVRMAGVPTAAKATELLEGMRAELWA